MPADAQTKALKITPSASSRYALSWDLPGTPTGDVEVLVKIQYNHTSNLTDKARIFIHGSGTDTSEEVYYLSAPGLTSTTIAMGKYNNAVSDSLNGGVYTFTRNIWHWVRFQRTGTTIQFKMWADGSAEPGAWTQTDTDSTISTGWVGVGNFTTGGSVWIDQFSVGTGGDPAPYTSVPIADVIHEAGQAVYESTTASTTHAGTTIPGEEIEDGELIEMWIGYRSATTNNVITWPTGFTEIIKQDVTPTRGLAVAWKRASSESGNYGYTLSQSSQSIQFIRTLRNVISTGNPVAGSVGTNDTTGSTSRTFPTFTNPEDGTWISYGTMVTGASPSNWTPPTGVDEDGEFVNTGSNTTSLMIAHESAPVDAGTTPTRIFTSVSTSTFPLVSVGYLVEPPPTPTQDIAPTGIASDEAFGTAKINRDVKPTGIASAETFGTLKIFSDQAIQTTGIASGEAFGTAAVKGSRTITVTGIASAEAFGTATVAAGQVISPTGIASQEAFGTPSLMYPQFVTPSGIPTGESFGTPVIGQSQIVAPSGISSGEAFGTLSISSTADIAPTSITSGEAFGAASVLLSTPGADRVAAATTTFEPTDDVDVTQDIVDIDSDIEYWLTNPAENFGWVIVSSNETATDGSAATYVTKEGIVAGQRPILEVTYYEYDLPEPIFIEKGTYLAQELEETGTGAERVRISKLSLDDYISGSLGPITYTFGLRQYDSQGVFLRDISEYVENLKIDWDEKKVIKRSMTCEIKGDLDLEKRHLLEPFGTLTMISPLSGAETEIEFVFGRYTNIELKNKIGLSNNARSIAASDRTIFLVDKTLEENLTLNAGASYTTEIRNLCIDAGFADEDILMPYTDVVMPTPMTWEVGESYYDIVTMLAEAVNWYSPYFDNNDKLTFLAMQDLQLRQPDVMYATDERSMILPDISVDRKITRVPNRILISVDDAMRLPFTVTYTNNSVDNPHSVTNTGEIITEVIETLDHIASSGVAYDRAMYIAQEFAGEQYTVELKTWIDLRRKPHEVYAVYVTDPENDETILVGNWKVIGWSMSLTTGGDMTHQLMTILPV